MENLSRGHQYSRNVFRIIEWALSFRSSCPIYSKLIGVSLIRSLFSGKIWKLPRLALSWIDVLLWLIFIIWFNYYWATCDALENSVSVHLIPVRQLGSDSQYEKYFFTYSYYWQLLSERDASLVDLETFLTVTFTLSLSFDGGKSSFEGEHFR